MNAPQFVDGFEASTDLQTNLLRQRQDWSIQVWDTCPGVAHAEEGMHSAGTTHLDGLRFTKRPGAPQDLAQRQTRDDLHDDPEHFPV
jgi:hypothetical protein